MFYSDRKTASIAKASGKTKGKGVSIWFYGSTSPHICHPI